MIRGRIYIFRLERGGWSWRIKMAFGQSLRYEYTVETEWQYGSGLSARAAAKRWAERLGIRKEKMYHQ